MQDLIRAIESTLDTNRTGAQVIARDDHTVLLYHNDFLAQEVLERESQTSMDSYSNFIYSFGWYTERKFTEHNRSRWQKVADKVKEEAEKIPATS